MGNLTANLSRYEFYCKCGKCKNHAADHELVEVIQEAADYFSWVYNRRIVVIINSGNRCEAHNRDEGGSDNSRHLYGYAADWFIRDVPIQQLYGWLEDKARENANSRWGIGKYPNRVHLDMRDTPARWTVA